MRERACFSDGFVNDGEQLEFTCKVMGVARGERGGRFRGERRPVQRLKRSTTDWRLPSSHVLRELACDFAERAFFLAIAGAMSGRSKHTEPGGKRGDCQWFGGDGHPGRQPRKDIGRQGCQVRLASGHSPGYRGKARDSHVSAITFALLPLPLSGVK
jgi:hypothetical protein